MSKLDGICTTRLATADDVPALAALFVEMLRYYDDPPSDEAAAADALRRHVFAPGAGIELLVAESAGRLAGFATLSPLFPIDGVGTALYMKELFVSDAVRSKGVGRRLLAGVARLAQDRGCVRVNWSAAADNTGAIRFYEGIGGRRLAAALSFELDANGIAALLESAEHLGKAVKYRSAGTVEYVYDSDTGKFHFLEVNTRLQVEHGLTEQVLGEDLVEWMVRLAAGQVPDFS